MFTPVQKAPYFMLMLLTLSVYQACSCVKAMKSSLQIGPWEKGEKGRGVEVLGHLFWRKPAKSGHDDCMVNLLRFISLFRDFLKHSLLFL